MMERIVINGKEYLTYEIHEGAAVDQIGINMLENNLIHGLMMFKYVREENRDYFRYDAGSEESLDKWLTQIRYKEEVITMLNSILAVYEEVPVYLLKSENLVSEIANISVMGGKCLFAYVPAEDIKGDCISLVQRVLSRVKYPMDEDYSYIFDMQNAYGRGEIKNIADIRRWIRIVSGEMEAPSNDGYEKRPQNRDNVSAGSDMKREIVQEQNMFEKKVVEPKSSSLYGNAPSEPISGSPYASTPSAPTQEKNDAVNDIFAEFGIPVSVKVPEKGKKEKTEKEKKSGIRLFGKKKEEPFSEPIPMQVQVPQGDAVYKQQMVINDLNRGNNTVLVDSFGGSTSAGLVRDKNRQEYALRTGESIIGSGRDADIMISDNSAISRRHARVFSCNGDYYIEDLGSTNGTCVNGEVLTPRVPCLIRDMSHIKISNETFTFRVGR